MDREEFREGLRETSTYLLSHHEPEDFYRCYSFSFLDKNINLCARCTGIYPGIAAGITQLAISNAFSLYIVALLGIPTLLEKYFTDVKSYRGSNILRSITGFMLGLGYVNGIKLLLENPFKPPLVIIAAAYALLGLALIQATR